VSKSNDGATDMILSMIENIKQEIEVAMQNEPAVVTNGAGCVNLNIFPI